MFTEYKLTEKNINSKGGKEELFKRDVRSILFEVFLKAFIQLCASQRFRISRCHRAFRLVITLAKFQIKRFIIVALVSG